MSIIIYIYMLALMIDCMVHALAELELHDCMQKLLWPARYDTKASAIKLYSIHFVPLDYMQKFPYY